MHVFEGKPSKGGHVTRCDRSVEDVSFVSKTVVGKSGGDDVVSASLNFTNESTQELDDIKVNSDECKENVAPTYRFQLLGNMLKTVE